MMGDFALFGLQAAPIIRAAVDLLKRFGIKDQTCVLAAIALGAGLYVLGRIAEMYPAPGVWIALVVQTLAAALWAGTIHDTIKALNGRS